MLVFGCNIRNRNELHFCEFADNLWQWSFIFHCLPRSLGPVIYYASVNSWCAHALPGNCRALIVRIVSPGGGELANYARPRGRAFANIWATPELFGTHMHSFWNITKHGGFYWKHQQICRLTHLSWIYACISSLLNQARTQELLSWVDIFVLLWNEISVHLGFDYNLAVMIFLILLSLIYLLYLLFHNIWLCGT